MSPTIEATSFRVTLSQSTVEKYDLQAKASNHTLEQELESRLKLFSDIDSSKPFILTDTLRQRLEKALGKNYNDADSMVHAVETVCSIKVDNIVVPVQAPLLQRLNSRCIGMPFDKFIIQTVRRALEEFAGMR